MPKNPFDDLARSRAAAQAAADDEKKQLAKQEAAQKAERFRETKLIHEKVVANFQNLLKQVDVVKLMDQLADTLGKPKPDIKVEYYLVNNGEVEEYSSSGKIDKKKIRSLKRRKNSKPFKERELNKKYPSNSCGYLAYISISIRLREDNTSRYDGNYYGVQIRIDHKGFHLNNINILNISERVIVNGLKTAIQNDEEQVIVGGWGAGW